MLRVVVLEYRRDSPEGGAVAREVVVPLAHVPAQVGVAGVTRGEELDLFPVVLADVADPQLASHAVEGEAPRVPQAIVPDLSRLAGIPGERLVGRDVRRRKLRVDAQQLA
jgi:hypothetical protein